MSQKDKSYYWNALKQAGVKFDKHYRNYTAAELRQSFEALQAATGNMSAPMERQPEQPAPTPAPPKQAASPRQPAPPLRAQDPNELPGQRLNTKPDDEPIRVDENGLIWYQEEVRKPSYPKPRGRRVLKYNDPGTRQVTAQAGEYIETFEVAGDRQIPSEVKITLPSYQVGIYKDPRFPFKIHVYNEMRGFDLFEVQEYYHGPELVPAEIKRIYVENVLCYDIRTTVRAIETEFRQLQLQGKA